MKANIFIAGNSGAGKSTSLRNLNPETTILLNTERKQLPFRGAGKFKKQMLIKNWLEFLNALEKAKLNQECDLIVIDSFTSLSEMLTEYCKKTWKNFDVWSNYASLTFNLFQDTKTIDKYVVFIGIDEVLQDADGQVTRHVRVDGKALKGSIEKEFVIVLWAMVQKAGDDVRHVFQTNNDGVTTAKSPMEMFVNQYIDNDLAYVIEEVKKYYEGE